MKKRNRVLGAVGGVVFGAIIVTFLISYLIYFGNDLKFGFSFVDAIKGLKIIFDFKQTQLYLITQYLTLGLFFVGAFMALLWLILGACKKHIIEILFFLGTCVAFFFFGLVAMYHGESLIRSICEPAGGKIDWNVTGRLIVLPSICVVLFAGWIVTFSYDMNRIFSKDEPRIIVEPEQYTQEALFKEVFGEEKQASKVEYTPDEETRIKEVMQKVDSLIFEEEVASRIPLTEDDIPAILRTKDEEKEEVIEHLPFLDKPMPEEKEEVIEHLPILDKPDPLPIDEKAPDLSEIPDILKTDAELEKEGKSSKEELLPFMKDGFVAKTEKSISKEASLSFDKLDSEQPKAFHISKGENGYQVKAAGSKEVLGNYDSEEEAIEAVRLDSPNASIRLHDKNGKIRSL